ncbi:CPBP family intramembrane glutamic endopeptidase [Clostridium peptidivorans]|uniref:CPBP family intramembrane glutamic endopeptidase n=1 Tax=Clostridium peptidivorans TaxID=100174 RepID=UPI000BE35F0F|nr:type II CAAX endopeptidase family protein [Clostridium peptidivorans]
MSEYSVSNKELIIFFVVTFGFTIGMGIIMAFTYTKYSMHGFAQVQMYYPAIGVMTALLLNNERRKELPMKFYGVYLFLTITSVFFLLVEIFIFHKDPGTYADYLLFPGSIMLVLMYFADEKEKIDRFGLKLGKNVKKSLRYIVLFVILRLCAAFLSAFIFGDVKEFINIFLSAKTFTGLFMLLLLFPFQFAMFLGEEYGWRYFLQTALQERLGKRKGIILLGFIWGIWHLPLNLFFYSPEAPFYSTLNRLIVCIAYAIFFGFVYMKTKNIWTVSIIHFLNNGLIFYSIEANIANSGKFVLINLLCASIVYFPFLFSKEYEKYEKEIELTNDL